MKNDLYVNKLKEIRIFKIRIDSETIGSCLLFAVMIIGFLLFWFATP